jgi:hypothetical protein
VRPFLDAVFSRTRDKARVHGFGVTTSSLLDRYPFYSVDSATPMFASSNGRALVLDGFTIRQSRRSVDRNRRTAFEQIEQHVMGPTPERRAAYLRQFQALADRYTRLWEQRGVVWT